ncbi:MAG: hypothetical protein HY088_03175 [Ignavibacteriales bacterium]|nr:hypothetical protein [Ignavibacteriales bacterium]
MENIEIEAVSKTLSVVMSGLAPKAHACAICLAHPCLRQAGAFGGKALNVLCFSVPDLSRHACGRQVVRFRFLESRPKNGIQKAGDAEKRQRSW